MQRKLANTTKQLFIFFQKTSKKDPQKNCHYQKIIGLITPIPTQLLKNTISLPPLYHVNIDM